MEPIRSFLKRCKLARKQSYKNLTVFPVLAPKLTTPDYLTLEQALDKNLVRITEMDQAGSVPELRLLNQAKKKLLIVEGEELVGAKQNRIVNATFLVAAETEIVIPVSCVEQGRWRYDSNEFSSGKRMMHASLRRSHQSDVKFSLNRGNGYRSNQGKIWEDIEGKLQRMKVAAPTSALSDAYERYDGTLSDFTDHFHMVEHQVGALFTINGHVLGLECFGSSVTFERFFEKIVKSYALDALDNVHTAKHVSVPPEKARRFIQSAANGKTGRHASIGLGQTVTVESRIVTGAALVEKKSIVHLSAFRKEKPDSGGKVRFQRFSERRRRQVL